MALLLKETWTFSHTMHLRPPVCLRKLRLQTVDQWSFAFSFVWYWKSKWQSKWLCSIIVTEHILCVPVDFRGRWCVRVTSHVWMSHVPRINESCLTSEWDISRIIDAEHILSSPVRSLKALECMTYVPTYEWVILRIIVAEHILKFSSTSLTVLVCVCVCVCVDHVPHTNESCCTHVSHIWMSHVARMCSTYEWVMSHACVPHMNESCRTHVSHIWMSHVVRMCQGVIVCVTWHIHLYAWHVSYIRKNKNVCTTGHDSFICVTWRIRIRDMTYTWHGAFIAWG